jgi:hypothetical protein
MRYPVIKPPTRQEQALIRRKIKEVVKEQGGLRPAARHLKIKSSYLRKSDRLLFPKADVQMSKTKLF